MENLNAEQIISKLMENDSCYAEDIKAIRNAISLIKSQEQRIKELTEEIERLKIEVSVKRKLLDKAEVRIECVEEENNQLKADICNAEMNLGHITEDNQAKDETITNLIATIKDIQADTVRKMRELVRKKIKKTDWLNGRAGYVEIDQIAKEMLEGENEN